MPAFGFTDRAVQKLTSLHVSEIHACPRKPAVSGHIDGVYLFDRNINRITFFCRQNGQRGGCPGNGLLRARELAGLRQLKAAMNLSKVASGCRATAAGMAVRHREPARSTSRRGSRFLLLGGARLPPLANLSPTLGARTLLAHELTAS